MNTATLEHSSQKRDLQQWLAEYSESHRNLANKIIHMVMVPTIYWTIVGFFWSIPVPEVLNAVPGLNFSALVLLVSTVFYIRLSLPVAIGMGLFTVACIGSFAALEALAVPVFSLCLGVFIVAWIFQFIGHYVEGKKPSFFKDIQFLMIGPAWVANHLMSRVTRGD